MAEVIHLLSQSLEMAINHQILAHFQIWVFLYIELSDEKFGMYDLLKSPSIVAMSLQLPYFYYHYYQLLESIRKSQVQGEPLHLQEVWVTFEFFLLLLFLDLNSNSQLQSEAILIFH